VIPTKLKASVEGLRGHEREVELVIGRAVHPALVDSGPNVQQLDWASMRARIENAGAENRLQLRFSNEWLRRKISADPDQEPSAGGSIVEPTAREATVAPHEEN
jgi:hypothetical protein